jgi:hypothetical protein
LHSTEPPEKRQKLAQATLQRNNERHDDFVDWNVDQAFNAARGGLTAGDLVHARSPETMLDEGYDSRMRSSEVVGNAFSLPSPLLTI